MAWHSLRDQNAGNKHVDVPGIYSSRDLFSHAVIIRYAS